jgi:phage gp29-like protein
MNLLSPASFNHSGQFKTHNDTNFQVLQSGDLNQIQKLLFDLDTKDSKVSESLIQLKAKLENSNFMINVTPKGKKKTKREFQLENELSKILQNIIKEGIISELVDSIYYGIKAIRIVPLGKKNDIDNFKIIVDDNLSLYNNGIDGDDIFVNIGGSQVHINSAPFYYLHKIEQTKSSLKNGLGFKLAVIMGIKEFYQDSFQNDTDVSQKIRYLVETVGCNDKTDTDGEYTLCMENILYEISKLAYGDHIGVIPATQNSENKKLESTTKVTPIEVKQGDKDLLANMLKYADERIANLIIGGVVLQSDGGNRSLGENQERTKFDIIEMYSSRFENSLKDIILTILNLHGLSTPNDFEVIISFDDTKTSLQFLDEQAKLKALGLKPKDELLLHKKYLGYDVEYFEQNEINIEDNEPNNEIDEVVEAVENMDTSSDIDYIMKIIDEAIEQFDTKEEIWDYLVEQYPKMDFKNIENDIEAILVMSGANGIANYYKDAIK